MLRVPDPTFWRGRRVFLTGHTGFKGAWLAFWLERLGADVTGYALAPATEPSAFALLGIAARTRSIFGDVRDRAALRTALGEARPEIVFHLAAQALVLEGYREPAATFDSNVTGTVNLLDAVRSCTETRAVVVVTTDKVYAENGGVRAYRESDTLGGADPYAASKACAELVTAAYRDAFLRQAGVGVASVRAGNVIGGGDWSADRLIPDVVGALLAGSPLALRHPAATRPWQHVLEPLSAYLIVAEHLVSGSGADRAWNVGPDASSVATVGDVVARFERAWGGIVAREEAPAVFHEAAHLTLDAGAVGAALGWVPRLDLDEAIELTAHWYRDHAAGAAADELTARQIERYGAR